MVEGLTFITGNAHKAKYAQLWLKHPITHHKLDLDELQSMDMEEIISHKARQAYEILKKPVLVEDNSLEFVVLNGFPGPFVKWVLKSAGLEAMCRMLDGFADRRLIGRTYYGFYDGNDEVRIFKGEMYGTLADHPKGEDGFGWDSVFINDGYDITRAEMDADTYEKTSYRKDALKKLHEFLVHYE